MYRHLTTLMVAFGVIFVLLSGCDKTSTDSDPEPVVVDIVNPNIQISLPTMAGGWVTVDETIVISGTASDDKQLKSIHYSVDGGIDQTATGLENWQTSPILLSNGDHTIIITAFDDVNNNSSDTIMVTKNPYLNFIGMPYSNPPSIFKNNLTEVVFKVSIAYNPNLVGSSVRLVRVNANNTVIDTIAILVDNGNLSQADEISGDGVFSAYVDLDEADETTLRLRFVAFSSEGSEPNFSIVFPMVVYPELDDSDVQKVIDVQGSAETFLNDSTSGLEISAATNKLAEWIGGQSGVQNATVIGDDIEVKYTSGLEGMILLIAKDGNGDISTKGGSGNNSRGSDPGISIGDQTRGITSTSSFKRFSVFAEEDVIYDKDVLIWAPYENVFSPDMRPTLLNIFNNSELGLNVTTLSNQQCTINSLNNLTSYGIVVFDTHGSNGQHILTGEIVTDQNRAAYALLLAESKIQIFTNIVYDRVLWIFDKTADMYSVRPAFINALPGTFANSVIFNGSCESTTNPNLSNAFLGKGAGTYFGFDDVVNTTFCRDMADDIFQSLVIDLETTGQAFVANQNDPVSPFATFEMTGSDQMHFSLSLQNGNFETGDLTAWTQEGDGRVITQLGNLTPPENTYMGIVSTGLGFTEQTGSISQSFNVDVNNSILTLDWNFLSEEFDEFVGTIYQDYFIIEVIHNGTVHTLFSRTIDDIWNQFTMIYVSPTIVFDQGDVWMTGWNTNTYDLSAYAGETIRLVLRTGDIGDSIYDTAVLFDNIAMVAP